MDDVFEAMFDYETYCDTGLRLYFECVLGPYRGAV